MEILVIEIIEGMYNMLSIKDIDRKIMFFS